MLVWETQVLLLLLLTSLFLFLPASRLSSAKQHVLNLSDFNNNLDTKPVL